MLNVARSYNTIFVESPEIATQENEAKRQKTSAEIQRKSNSTEKTTRAKSKRSLLPLRHRSRENQSLGI